jgi:hypothetical protein
MSDALKNDISVKKAGIRHRVPPGIFIAAKGLF